MISLADVAGGYFVTVRCCAVESLIIEPYAISFGLPPVAGSSIFFGYHALRTCLTPHLFLGPPPLDFLVHDWLSVGNNK